MSDRTPKTQNKEMEVDDLVLNNAEHDPKKGLLSWKLKLQPRKSQTEQFSFQVKYPRGKYISL